MQSSEIGTLKGSLGASSCASGLEALRQFEFNLKIELSMCFDLPESKQAVEQVILTSSLCV